LVNTEPCASSTAGLTKFSDAISSTLSCWRAASQAMARAIFRILPGKNAHFVSSKLKIAYL
jgi:hypothetical protein